MSHQKSLTGSEFLWNFISRGAITSSSAHLETCAFGLILRMLVFLPEAGSYHVIYALSAKILASIYYIYIANHDGYEEISKVET